MNIVHFETYVHAIDVARLALMNYVQVICSKQTMTKEWRLLHAMETESLALHFLHCWKIVHEARYVPILDVPFAILRVEFINAKDIGEYRFADKVNIELAYYREASPDLLKLLPLVGSKVRKDTVCGVMWRKPDVPSLR